MYLLGPVRSFFLLTMTVHLERDTSEDVQGKLEMHPLKQVPFLYKVL